MSNTLFPISRFSLSNPLKGDIETLFDSFFNTPLRAVQRTDDSYYSIPRANVSRDDEGYYIQLAAPGYIRSDFNINVENMAISISCTGESHAVAPNNSTYTTQEYNYTSFSRSWALPAEADTSSIGAKYEAGILTVNIPVASTNSTSLKVEVK